MLPGTFYNEDCNLNVSISETLTEILQDEDTNVSVVESAVDKISASVSTMYNEKCLKISNTLF